MRVLLTGGAGFIGSHVMDRYIQEGHHVVVVDDLSTGREENLNPKAIFYKMDIRDRGVMDVFERERPDVVNHHAAQMDVRRSVDDPVFDADVNILGMLNLLEASCRYDVKRFIFASTGGAIYGEQEYFPADEDHPTRPLSPYGVSKLAGETYLFYYKMQYGLDYVTLRYSNVYGPRQNPHGEAGVVAIFTERMLRGGQPIINGDGTQTRDFVYVGDVVEANLLALRFNSSDPSLPLIKSGASGTGIFNIGTGIETNINHLFKTLKEITRADVEEVHGPPKEGEQKRSVIDFKKAERVLGWRPRIGLVEGLKKTVECFGGG